MGLVIMSPVSGPGPKACELRSVYELGGLGIVSAFSSPTFFFSHTQWMRSLRFRIFMVLK